MFVLVLIRRVCLYSLSPGINCILCQVRMFKLYLSSLTLATHKDPQMTREECSLPCQCDWQVSSRAIKRCHVNHKHDRNVHFIKGFILTGDGFEWQVSWVFSTVAPRQEGPGRDFWIGPRAFLFFPCLCGFILQVLLKFPVSSHILKLARSGQVETLNCALGVSVGVNDVSCDGQECPRVCFLP